ncbi:MAG: hypothetical protein GOU99_03040, partial [Candidatus Altiarchaeota archaeon]|nr:hypothetical protein [Candidatus Altiarchaeota archaeon]
LIAILVGFTSLSSFYFVFQLFLIAYSIGIIHSKSKKSRSQLLLIYELLLIAWLFGLVDTIMYISPAVQVGVYLVSTTIFLLILKQVWKRLGAENHGKKA